MYYIHYDEKANINYCFILSLSLIAKPNYNTKLSSTIQYNTLKDLANTINDKCGYKISVSTISKILNNTEQYKMYLTHNKTSKTITLMNCFRKDMPKVSNKFITLTDKEIHLLIQYNKTLFCKYLLYIKYYCGYTKSGSIDTTAKQILTAIGYSNNSNNYISQLCVFNKILIDSNIITINKYRDNNGMIRNVYKYN